MKRKAAETQTCRGVISSAFLCVLCVLSVLSVGRAHADDTNAIRVNAVVLLLPANYAGQSYSGMTFQPTNAGRTLLLYPCTDCGGGTNITVAVAGITNLNGLLGFAQTLVAGTAGTDFAISSAGTTHTFNLPTASAANRGALSSADWMTFNAKQAPITFNTDQFAASATHTNIKSGALQTNGIFKADAGSSRALMADTNIFVVTNGQVAVRVPPDANGYLTVEGAALTGIVVKHSTGSPRTLFGSAEVGTLTDTTLVIDVNGGQRWNFGDSTLSYALYPGTSNTTDLARSSLPARAAYIGTNYSRETHGQIAYLSNDLFFGTSGQFSFHFLGDDDGYLSLSNNVTGVRYFQLDASSGNSITFDGTVVSSSFQSFGAVSSLAGAEPFGSGYDLGSKSNPWRNGWFANTLNTTGLCAGITYVTLTSGSYTNSTNNFTVMMPNGSARTNWLNTAAGVGSIQIVKDDRGTAAGTNIIVKATSGTIDEATSYTLNTAYGAVWFQCDGTNWQAIAKF